jgi:hypothetical protein
VTTSRGGSSMYVLVFSFAMIDANLRRSTSSTTTASQKRRHLLKGRKMLS